MIRSFMVVLALVWSSLALEGVALSSGAIPSYTSVAELQAESPSNGDLAYLNVSSRVPGVWRFDSSDLSGTMVGSSGRVTSIDTGSDEITLARHGLHTGYAIVPGNENTDLATNQIYYAIVDEDSLFISGAGSVTGGMTNGGGNAAAFDDETTETFANSAQSASAASAFLNFEPTSSTSYTRMVVYGSSNQGFVNEANPAIQIEAYGHYKTAPTTYQECADDGTLLGSLSFADTDDESGGREIKFIERNGDYDDICVRIGAGTAQAFGITELRLYENRAPSTFQVASSFANALAGTAVDFSDSTVFSFDQLTDPAGCAYIPVNASSVANRRGNSGAWVRQNIEAVTPEMCGASPIATWDSPEDATQELSSWAAIIEASALQGHVDDFYKSSLPFFFTKNKLKIDGIGGMQTGFLFDGSDGFNFQQSVDYPALDMRGIGLLTNSDRSYVALYVSKGASSGDAGYTHFENIVMMGTEFWRNRQFGTPAGPFTDGWMVGVMGYEADRASCVECLVHGPNVDEIKGLFPITTAGFSLRNTTDFRIWHSEVRFTEFGIYLRGQSESLSVMDSAIVAVRWGIDLENFAGVNPNGSHEITDTHNSSFDYDLNIASATGGLTGVKYVAVSGGVWLKRIPASGNGTTGFNFIKDNGIDTRVARVSLFTKRYDSEAVTSGDTAISIGAQSRNSQYSDITFINQNQLVSIASGASDFKMDGCTADDNDGHAPYTAVIPISDSGTDSIWMNCWPRDRQWAQIGSTLVVRQSSVQPHTSSGSFIDVNWNAEVINDFGSSWFAATDSDINIQLAGRYKIEGAIEFASGGTGIRQVNVFIVGSHVADVDGDCGAADPSAHIVCTFELPIYELSAGDVVKVRAFQNSGGSLDMGPGSWLSITRM